MALTRNHRLDDSDMCLKPMFSYYENDEFGGSPGSIQGSDDQSSPQKSSHKICQGSSSPSLSPVKNNNGISNSSSSSPSSSNSSGLVYPTLKYHQSDDGNSIFGFKGGYGNSPNAHTSGSLLSFGLNEHFHHQNSFSNMNNKDDFSIWEDNMHHGDHVRLKNASEAQFGWMNLEPTPSPSSGITDLGREERCLKKRPFEEETAEPPKKQCINPTKQAKSKEGPSKDPQSLAAKNRRERISERLKTLQELVPNGSKVDLVTMLEKAIGYVKFLQLQVKILATDEFWPVQGGKAPELSKVQDAIDTILASQRDRNSSSK